VVNNPILPTPSRNRTPFRPPIPASLHRICKCGEKTAYPEAVACRRHLLEVTMALDPPRHELSPLMSACGKFAIAAQRSARKPLGYCVHEAVLRARRRGVRASPLTRPTRSPTPVFSSGRRKSAQSRPRILDFTRI
jgi:hypothetical protein